jgi:hypothetical protein
VVAVIGTFLPWLRSGDVRRNSYTSFGLLQRLIGFHGVGEVLIRGWPLFGALSAAVVLVAVAGLHRTAGVLALASAAILTLIAQARAGLGGTERVRASGPAA